MTKEECVQFLTIMKATYPQSFRGMNAADGKATITVWADEFMKIDFIHIKEAFRRYKLDGEKAFAPTINDIHRVLDSMRSEARIALMASREFETTPELPKICKNCSGEVSQFLNGCQNLKCYKNKEFIAQREANKRRYLLTPAQKEFYQRFVSQVNNTYDDLSASPRLAGCRDGLKQIGE